jgi:hypothetical protein
MKRSVSLIFAAGLLAAAANAELIHVVLNYNFNGMVHAGEAGMPDNPDGFRSISDRGLDLTIGVPANEVLDNYSVVDQAGVLDIVHLGNRNTVDGGNWAFGTAANGDPIGIQPNWLPDPDQTGPQTTLLNPPITLTGNSFAGIVFQISNGGGVFDARFHFDTGNDFRARLFGPDWFGPFGGTPNIGLFPGRENVDMADPGATLLLTEEIVDLSLAEGRQLLSISFENRSNLLAGYAVIAVNVEGERAGGCDPCDCDCNGTVDAFDIEPFIDVLVNGPPGCSACAGDADGNGTVDAFDIEPFIECLVGP